VDLGLARHVAIDECDAGGRHGGGTRDRWLAHGTLVIPFQGRLREADLVATPRTTRCATNTSSHTLVAFTRRHHPVRICNPSISCGMPATTE
jgi:hypothetical protein